MSRPARGSKAGFRFAMADLWHGPLTPGEIVRRFSRSYRHAFGRVFSERRLDEMWTAMRGDLLPLSLQRPRVAGEGDADGIAYSADGEIVEGAPIRGSDGLAIPDGDPLLRALVRAHGADPRRVYDDAAEPKGMPSQATLRDGREMRDRINARLQKISTSKAVRAA